MSPQHITRRLFCSFTITPLFFLICSIAAFAQWRDNTGWEFWVTFMPNLGSNGAGETSDLQLYLTCDRPTTVNITYTLTNETKVITIPEANRSVDVKVRSLFGDFIELEDVLNQQTGEIFRKSFHIVSQHPVVLSGANIRSKSADGFLGLPEDVLGREYIILAYPNGYSGNQTIGRYDTPSQFAIVATEDETRVTISPPPGLTINRRSSDAYTVMLNRGEVYLGQADVYEKQELDVSGTGITATRPVAVFAGNKRTSVPTQAGDYRDHLVEQLPPTPTWGKEALVVPHFIVTPNSRDTSRARVITSAQQAMITVLTAGGPASYTLERGKVLDLPLLGPMKINSTEPILVAQYEHSVNIDSSGFIGDPFMMLVVPTETFDLAYTFQNIIHREFLGNRQYINVIAPTDALGTLRLDGAAVNAQFLPIPGSTFSYAQVRVTPGAHTVHCDALFAAYVYGFGSATSYGYPAGMQFAVSTIGVDAKQREGEEISMRIVPSVVTGASAMLEIEMPEPGDALVELRDLNGKLVRSISANESVRGSIRTELDCSGLANGVYSCRATIDGERVIVGRFIVER